LDVISAEESNNFHTLKLNIIFPNMARPQKTLVIGAGPVGALAALYAASRGDEVEVYELRGGEF